MTTENIKNLAVNSLKAAPATKKFFAQLKKTKPGNLDTVVAEIHDQVFERTNCLNCANCCKTTGPRFTNKDIERLAKHFRVKPSQFIDKYLHIDEDHDFVLNELPCAFLGADNYCSVYDIRPEACREYPHTNRKQFHKILDITLKNTAICPAAFEIVEELKKRMEKI